MKRTLGCVGCLVLCAAAGAWAAGSLVPAELKCEYRVDPAGIGETAPRLTWILTGEGRGLYQAAYQILAADSEAALARDEGTLWDSGKVASGESALVPYGGKPLASRAQCFWKVRVWARGQEEPSDWSAPARFSVGLLAPEDWSAEWIGYDAPAEDEAVPRDPYTGSFWVWYPEGVAPEAFPSGKRWLRKGFTVPQGAKITQAVLYATADNGARVNLNGERVGRGEEAIQSHSKRYEFDVTALVKPGENQLAAEVENAQGNAGFIATLDVTLEDGSMLSVRTDKTWKAVNEQPGRGWRDTAFDDTKWTAAQEVEVYPGKPWGPLFGK
ncbi:MAG TPA: alpha-L-rhamnosidase N-terminal domain-containing protein, partial [Candidatus Hydrogenedentes bacterium]|nr:alpha-L-rhamnosidase N-terminal domain-containing protein [Candidatus Hydrogenedentota bacterium]